MEKRIIHPNDADGVSVIIPAPGCGLSVEDIARKDVPAGKPFLIVDAADIPTDRTFRSAWEADFSAPDGFGVGAEAWFAKQAEEPTE